MSITTHSRKDSSRFEAGPRLGCARITEDGPPTHPGQMLLEEFLKPLGISQRQLAEAVHLPYRQVNGIVNGHRPVTPAIALRFTKYIGMSVGFWMNCQLAWDLHHALKREEQILNTIEPLPRPDLPELLQLAGLEEQDCK